MAKSIFEIKKETEKKFAELRVKRKGVVSNFKKKLEEIKIERIRKSILGK
jgi:hypothetical protein